ncbi:hypothetical protein BIFADO_00223 [Bifidobacterium adolescentis L2-32]|uniref:Uncharacterized protein n=1 Tax=Bifidobacterium adolescentis L2-32 TaxID=411481 RepID=A7A335_BIFAD|nr:hypothetical protein BIFADO_00223 [Bifidobacterium adolescentis L2-32]
MCDRKRTLRDQSAENRPLKRQKLTPCTSDSEESDVQGVTRLR